MILSFFPPHEIRCIFPRKIHCIFPLPAGNEKVGKSATIVVVEVLFQSVPTKPALSCNWDGKSICHHATTNL